MTLRPGSRRSSPETLLLGALLLAWAAALVVLLLHRLVVTNDSLSNYAHVWYIGERIRQGEGLPYRFPEIGHGKALAYPYGFIPWTTAGLLRPLLGEWVTTLWLVLGTAGLFVAMRLAFPDVRSPLARAAALANPFLVESVILFQLPFIWAAAMLFAGIALWRREHPWWAAIAAGLAQATHPPMLLPITGAIVVVWLWWEPRRRALLAAWLVSLAIAAPAVALVFLSPVVEDSSAGSLIANFAGTLALRALMVAGPFAALLLERRWRRFLWPTLALLLALNVVLIPVRHNEYAWGSFTRTPDTTLDPFLHSAAFTPGDTYRVLRAADGKAGMYQVLKAGGRLDSEFFPESIDRRSWDSSSEYAAFLARRHVDDVLIFANYSERFHTNEGALLGELVSAGGATVAFQAPEFTLFHILRDGAP